MIICSEYLRPQQRLHGLCLLCPFYNWYTGTVCFDVYQINHAPILSSLRTPVRFAQWALSTVFSFPWLLLVTIIVLTSLKWHTDYFSFIEWGAKTGQLHDTEMSLWLLVLWFQPLISSLSIFLHQLSTANPDDILVPELRPFPQVVIFDHKS